MNRVGRDSVEPWFSVLWRSGLDGVSPHRWWFRFASEFWRCSISMNPQGGLPASQHSSAAHGSVTPPPRCIPAAAAV